MPSLDSYTYSSSANRFYYSFDFDGETLLVLVHSEPEADSLKRVLHRFGITPTLFLDRSSWLANLAKGSCRVIGKECICRFECPSRSRNSFVDKRVYSATKRILDDLGSPKSSLSEVL